MRFDWANAKNDKRPYVEGRGWGPGAYTHVCRQCGASYFGEKRSWECADCAYNPVPKPKLTTVWEGDSLDILARESIEGLTKHQPKGKSRYGN